MKKVAMITGATSGIGEATAKLFAQTGDYDLIIAGRRADRLKALKKELKEAYGTKVHVMSFDVRDYQRGLAALDSMPEEYRRIDILVNNAGGSAGLFGRLSRFRDAGEEVWSRVLDLNLHGTLRCIRAVLNPMIERRYGRIVSIASIAAAVGILDRVDYSAAKGGIVSLTKALAMEVGGYGVTVNSVSPGAIARRPTDSIPGGIYVGRMGTPEEVASLVAFLASEEAAFITGCDYIIDGGRVLGPARSMETTQHN